MKIFRLPVVALFALVVGLASANPGQSAVANPTARPKSSSNFVLVAHSGAGDYSHATPAMIEARRAAMVKAIQGGYAILSRGGSSLDAVEATIRVMEDAGLFDAG